MHELIFLLVATLSSCSCCYNNDMRDQTYAVKLSTLPIPVPLPLSYLINTGTCRVSCLVKGRKY